MNAKEAVRLAAITTVVGAVSLGVGKRTEYVLDRINPQEKITQENGDRWTVQARSDNATRSLAKRLAQEKCPTGYKTETPTLAYTIKPNVMPVFEGYKTQVVRSKK